MKVLLVLEATLGGTGRHILDLAGGLLERGMEVFLFYSIRRADRKFISGLASLIARQPDFHCHSIPITREVTVSDISSYIELSRFIREHGPFDVVHAHSTKAGFLARLLLNCRPARIIYTPHGLMSLNPELKGMRRIAVCALESALAYRSDAVIAVSEAERRCAINTGIDPSKLVVIPNGISQTPLRTQMRSRASIRDSIGLPADSLCIGMVGRFAPYKKPERVIEAFALLKRRYESNVRLAMIGAGPLETTLRRLVNRLGITDSVHFLGEVDGAAYMPAFDIFAHSSAFEAFGYVFVEALAAGLPIVTTRVGGTDELVSRGLTGYVCDPWDPDTFANYLQLLAEDAHLRATMSAAARERAAEFGIAKMVNSTADLYAQLCAKPDQAPAIPAKYQTVSSNSK